MTSLPGGESPWRLLRGTLNPVAARLANRRYNRQKVGAPQFVPPGACLVLQTADTSAVWATSWPFADYVRHAWAGAWVNSLFRNEGTLPVLGPDPVGGGSYPRQMAGRSRPWHGLLCRPEKTTPKEVPGWCYRRAGWWHVGFTEGGLYAFQQLPGR